MPADSDKMQKKICREVQAFNPGNKNTLFQQQNCCGDAGTRPPDSCITGDAMYHWAKPAGTKWKNSVISRQDLLFQKYRHIPTIPAHTNEYLLIRTDTYNTYTYLQWLWALYLVNFAHIDTGTYLHIHTHTYNTYQYLHIPANTYTYLHYSYFRVFISGVPKHREYALDFGTF